MYSAQLLDHFQNPRNVGELPPPAVTVRVENPACGDILQLAATWDGDTVQEARYRTRGCTASIAAGSALSEWLPGHSREALASLTATDVEAWVGGLPSASKHVATLCLDAVRALLRATPPRPIRLH